MFPNTKYLGVFLLLVDNIRKGAGHLEVSRPEHFYQTFQQQQIFLHNTFLAMINISNNLVATCSREKSKGLEGQRDAISHGECTWGSHPDDDDDGDDDDYDDDDDDSEGQHKL